MPSKRDLKLENRKKKVATIPDFLMRMLRYAFFAFLLIAFSLAVGTVGYMYFAKLNFIDSFYMASMILTGMGPTMEMTSNNAKIFSSFFALYSGVAFLSITAVFFAPLIHRLLHILHVESEDDEV
jgi:hypothetical protein